MKYIEKKCVLCGSEFAGIDDEKPNYQICSKCSCQFVSHINPKVTKVRKISEIIAFILFNIWMCLLYKDDFNGTSIKDMIRFDNSMIFVCDIFCIVYIAFHAVKKIYKIFILHKRKKKI